MTSFQLLAGVVFFGALVVVYFSQIKAWLSKLRPAVVTQTANQSMVADMVTVAELRDRLAKLGCKDGVDACTVLLRVMVEFKIPQG